MLTMTEQPRPQEQPQQTTHQLRKWVCRKPGCNRIQMEYSPDTRGVQVKICDKCGTDNRLEDGQPRR